ncbi:Lrp/AsnC family transcriptional regulator [Vibrio marisflavi]|uniref:Leucine-responsive regulatory protein n=1 Tax=Vibrio marisflavi CECT 7928 TaxID=634439 RepID=A0ABN8E8U8_9VIBR|nr:Lrp/AsnC family transcriptional regulator [Vibrio marisflavi]CAH0540731.1 Leucine-responsive regulatory protein [Vibrio marisflavi CECT 7928]
MQLDRLDIAILKHLQKNNRIANNELADKVGLSAPACLKRVKRLREENIIVGDVSILNPELAGNTMTLIVSVEMERDRADLYQRFRQSMAEASQVTQCYQVSGNYDFLLIVCVKDIQGYEHFVERVLHTQLNIRKFHTSVSLRTVKFSTEIELSEK